MMANAGAELENAKYATFFTLFDSDGLIAGKQAQWLEWQSFCGFLVLFGAAIAVFSRKDLHI